jgi:TM2 domain-containing membrane protein YozV
MTGHEKAAMEKEMTSKSVVVSIMLSFLIPGFGDLYCASRVKALVFFALDILAFILIFAGGIGVFLFALIWVCGLISAWLSANKSEKQKISKMARS